MISKSFFSRLAPPPGLLRLAPLFGFLLLAGASSSCTDPVFDAQVEALGDEAPGIAEGPLHRGGQPCVLCHSKYGPASDHVFVVGGTIYESADAKTLPAAGVEVLIVDSGGNSPATNPVTNEKGNFFVRPGDWSGVPRFPMRVAIARGSQSLAMASHIGRDGSCATCHRAPGKRAEVTNIVWVHL